MVQFNLEDGGGGHCEAQTSLEVGHTHSKLHLELFLIRSQNMVLPQAWADYIVLSGYVCW